MKILIVSTFFPPQNMIASQRPYSWAKWWSRKGHDITVLTTTNRRYPFDTPMPFDGFQVIEHPIPGIELLRRLPGLSAEEISNKEIQRKGIVKLFYNTLNFLQQRYGIFYACRMPDLHDLWAFHALKRINQFHWDAVVTTGWPYSVHHIGRALKRNGSADRWILDWRDLWTDNHLYPGFPLIRMLERRLEKKFHAAADIITTVSEPLAELLRKKAGNKVKVIYNGFDLEDYAALPKEKAFPPDGKFRIVYTGSIYPGKRDPTPLFSAIRKLYESGLIAPEKIQVLFAGHSQNVSELAQKERVASFVSVLGRLSRPQALAFQRDADALLFLEFEATGLEGILTGKLFEYLAAGPPIISVGIGERSSAGKIISECGRGDSLGKEVPLIADWILSSIAGKNNSLKPREINPTILTYSRENQADRLLELIVGAEIM